MKSYKELEEKCAYCGENMYVIVRAHHHTEMVNGREQDVTGEDKKYPCRCNDKNFVCLHHSILPIDCI